MAGYKREERLILPSGTLRHEVLTVLWESGESVLPEIARQLNRRMGREINRNTIFSTLEVLSRMEMVRRVRAARSRTYTYSALCSREELQRAEANEAVKRILRASKDKAKGIAYLMETIVNHDPELLDELQNVLKRNQGPRRRR